MSLKTARPSGRYSLTRQFFLLSADGATGSVVTTVIGRLGLGVAAGSKTVVSGLSTTTTPPGIGKYGPGQLLGMCGIEVPAGGIGVPAGGVGVAAGGIGVPAGGVGVPAGTFGSGVRTEG